MILITIIGVSLFAGSLATCPAGQFLQVGGTCQDCPINAYALPGGAAQCTECPTGTQTIAVGYGGTVADCNPVMREKLPGELAPFRIETSTTSTEVEDGKAHDMDMSTFATVTNEPGFNSWVQFSFSDVHCISRVVLFHEVGAVLQQWELSDGVLECSGECEMDSFSYTLTIDMQSGEDRDDSEEGSCRYGDRVKLALPVSITFLVQEMAVTEPVISCPAGQYRIEETACELCEEDQWSAAGSDECSTCPDGTRIESGPGTSESDCRMVAPEPSSAKNAIPTSILTMLGVLAAFF